MGKVFICLMVLSSAIRAEEIRHEISALQQERLTLVQAQKRLLEEIAGLEPVLQDLTVKISKKREAMNLHRSTIAEKYPLLVRLARTNMLRLLVDPSISKHTIHSLVLMRAFTTALKIQMVSLEKEMTDTTALSKELEAKNQRHLRILQEVESQQKDLSERRDEKINDWKKQETGRLADQTDTNSLLAEGETILSKAKHTIQDLIETQDGPLRHLEHPVIGEMLVDPGLQKKFSPQAKGVVFKTPKKADVYAPAKGKVVFKGPFSQKGTIIILDHGKGLHTLFMGMDEVSATINQIVYPGDGLGKMAGHGEDLPLLYMEVRRDGKAIDPQPYLTP